MIGLAPTAKAMIAAPKLMLLERRQHNVKQVYERCDGFIA